MSKLFLNLDAKEEKRLNWLIGFFVGTHVVAPTFKNRTEWTEKQIVEELQGQFSKAIYDKFFEWMKEKSDKASKIEDVTIYEKLCNSQPLKIQIESTILTKIPSLAKKYNAEREGYTTRRLIKEQVSKDDWNNILNKFNNTCAYCGAEDVLTKDHILPISKGGKHEVNNLVPACKTCNSTKNDILIDEWYPSYFHFEKVRYQKILDHIREGESN